ncbi:MULTISPECIES: MFS transporter [unclassified Arthrobacter]|uniref:MFS transporter n=1 Tax=unclassified Arthrobacter TaxID=235627 RepID=UPI001490F203|nr:MFS transporter [Arthrobacter sp. AET 35A]MBE0011412.1 MFS transporter [Arthrobacter sp. AET 35A]NOJ61268.1 MFS transporter [Arthrobacter sp. 260]
MNFALYRELLRIVPVRRLLIVGMIARFPHSAAGVLLTLHVVQTLDRGYAEAGAVAALLTIGIAVGAPWRGRRVDSAGLRKALIPSVIAEAVIWSVAPQLPYEWLLLAALVGGLFTLPAFSVVRQSLGVMVTGEKRRTAFTLDAIGTEMIFMVGPALGVILATQVSTVLGLTLVGLATAGAGLFLMWFNPPTRTDQLGASTSAPSEAEDEAAAVGALVAAAPAHVTEASAELYPGGRTAAGRTALKDRMAGSFAWLSIAVAVVLVVAAGAGLVLAGTEVGIVAALEETGREGELGLVFAAWCAASVVGGLVYGALRRPVSPLVLLLLMGLFTIPMGFAENTLALCLLSILPGLLCAPVLSAASERVADLVVEERRGEAMGWYGSALTSGVALGAPLAGITIDTVGPSAAFTTVGAVAVTICVLGLAAQQVRRRRANSPLGRG